MGSTLCPLPIAKALAFTGREKLLALLLPIYQLKWHMFFTQGASLKSMNIEKAIKQHLLLALIR